MRPREADLDAITKELPDNRPHWSYSEEVQQHRFNCEQCDNRFDILGEYGCCPVCGKRNSLQGVMSYFDAAQAQFESANASTADCEDRQIEWEKMTKCVSDFEAMAQNIQYQLARLPLTPTRRKEVEQISFQQMLRAEELMRRFFGIEVLKGVTDKDREFLSKMFSRRHILTHNAGRVDQEYLDSFSTPLSRSCSAFYPSEMPRRDPDKPAARMLKKGCGQRGKARLNAR